jgi:hypothetical protein
MKAGSDRTVSGRGAADPVEAVRLDRRQASRSRGTGIGWRLRTARRHQGATDGSALGWPTAASQLATPGARPPCWRAHQAAATTRAGGIDVDLAADSGPAAVHQPPQGRHAQPRQPPRHHRRAAPRPHGDEVASVLTDGAGGTTRVRPGPTDRPSNAEPVGVASSAHARAAERIGAMPWYPPRPLPVHPATRGPGGSANVKVGGRA